MSLPSVPPEAVPPKEPAADRSRVAQRLLDQPLRNFGVGVTALILGSTAAFGGLEEAQGGGIGSRVGTIKVGEKLEADPFEVTIKRLLWVGGDELPSAYPARSGDRWLVVIADIENTSDQTVLNTYATQTISIDTEGVKGMVRTPEPDLTTADDEDDRTTRVRADYVQQYADNSSLDPLQPGLTYSGVFLFEHDARVAAPDTVKVQLVQHSWRPDSLTQTEQWLDPTVVAEAELAVQPEKTAAGSGGGGPGSDDDSGSGGDTGSGTGTSGTTETTDPTDASTDTGTDTGTNTGASG